MNLPTTVPVDELHQALDLAVPVAIPAWRDLALTNWTMDADDSILRQVFRQFRPLRHLEFGTWRGEGVLRIVQECDATVWTINLLAGETRPNGEWAYATLAKNESLDLMTRTEQMKTHEGTWIRTDAYGQIGYEYLSAGYGNRVCQIYADSRQWDTRAYPDGFFDTAFIDGGHVRDVVENDSTRAIRLVRPGGLVIWHDFCPDPDVLARCGSTKGVMSYVTEHTEQLARYFRKLFWVSPSWLLFGVRSSDAVAERTR